MNFLCKKDLLKMTMIYYYENRLKIIKDIFLYLKFIFFSILFEKNKPNFNLKMFIFI